MIYYNVYAAKCYLGAKEPHRATKTVNFTAPTKYASPASEGTVLYFLPARQAELCLTLNSLSFISVLIY